MGFDLSIEADDGAEKLLNIHPAGYLTGGKAIFAFFVWFVAVLHSPLPGRHAFLAPCLHVVSAA